MENDRIYSMKLGIGSMLGIIACAIVPVVVFIAMIQEKSFSWIAFIVTVGLFGFLAFIPIYYSKTKIIVTDTEIICKRPDKVIKTPWNEITKVVKTWTMFAGGMNYIVFTKNQGTFGIPDTFIDYKEILDVVKEKTELKIKAGL